MRAGNSRRGDVRTRAGVRVSLGGGSCRPGAPRPRPVPQVLRVDRTAPAEETRLRAGSWRKGARVPAAGSHGETSPREGGRRVSRGWGLGRSVRQSQGPRTETLGQGRQWPGSQAWSAGRSAHLGRTGRAEATDPKFLGRSGSGSFCGQLRTVVFTHPVGLEGGGHASDTWSGLWQTPGPC